MYVNWFPSWLIGDRSCVCVEMVMHVSRNTYTCLYMHIYICTIFLETGRQRDREREDRDKDDIQTEQQTQPLNLSSYNIHMSAQET